MGTPISWPVKSLITKSLVQVLAKHSVREVGMVCLWESAQLRFIYKDLRTLHLTCRCLVFGSTPNVFLSFQYVSILLAYSIARKSCVVMSSNYGEFRRIFVEISSNRSCGEFSLKIERNHCPLMSEISTDILRSR